MLLKQLLAFAILAGTAFGQQPFRVADGTTTVIGPNPNSFYKGLLLPQSANADRPANKAGVILWNTDGTVAQINNGSGWSNLLDANTIGASGGVQAYDADLDDLADGSLSGSKVGTGIDAGNITAGTLATAQGGTGANALTNLITLATHTVGNFLATLSDNGSGTITVANSGAENAAVTVGVTADSISGTQLADSITYDAPLTLNGAGHYTELSYSGTSNDPFAILHSGAASGGLAISQTNAGDYDPTIAFYLGAVEQFRIGVDDSTANDNLVITDGATDRLTINGSTGAITVGQSLTAGTGLVATAGGVTATAGGITATAGNITNTAGFYVLPTATTLTIASDTVTVTQSSHALDTEGAAATDDLATINGGSEGMVLTLWAVSNVRDVVLKDGTGNLQLPGDVTLNHGRDTIILIYRGGLWTAASPLADNGT